MEERAVGVLMLRGVGVYVSERLDPTDGRHAGLYCGAGGLCKLGEPFALAAWRETREEAGLRVARVRFELIHENEGHTGKFPYKVQHFALELRDGAGRAAGMREEPERMEEKNGPWELVPLEDAVKLNLVPGMREALLKVMERRRSAG
jgi:8-oxo-dGTP pyrophosphatase MutT (NUDIX family)